VSRFIIAGKRRNLVSRETDSDSGYEPRILTIDSKGRISIPADIRRSLGMDSGDRILLGFDLEECIILLGKKRKGGDYDGR
jgi:AbrB family looped-hinge helix DNA binding protein